MVLSRAGALSFADIPSRSLILQSRQNLSIEEALGLNHKKHIWHILFQHLEGGEVDKEHRRTERCIQSLGHQNVCLYAVKMGLHAHHGEAFPA